MVWQKRDAEISHVGIERCQPWRLDFGRLSDGTRRWISCRKQSASCDV